MSNQNFKPWHDVKPHENDLRMIEEFKRLAKPLSPEERTKLLTIRLPPSKDYSTYLTLIRSQGQRGGCFLMTAMAIHDILKEMECPYTPDASFHFAEYVYNIAKPDDPSGYGRPRDPRVLPESGDYCDAQERELYGCCSEASFLTNYDPPHQLERPSDGAFSEAKHYRLHWDQNHIIHNPTVEEVKALLYLYGPLSAVNVILGHVFAIIGYDDNRIAQDGKKGGFIGVNSYGDQQGTNGMWCFSYELFAKLVEEQPSLYLCWFRNIPDLPLHPLHPFTARIKVKTKEGRRYITVAVGVEGKVPKVVWDHPCQQDLFDSSLNLTYDFPLPDYAGRFWPPNERNRWYVELRDTSPGHPSSQVAGTVEQITLVHRCLMGKTIVPLLYRPYAEHFPFTHGGTLKIYIPSRERYCIDINADHPQVSRGDVVKFTGTLRFLVGLSNTRNAVIPLSNQEVKVYEAKNDPVEGTIWENVIGTAETDNDGKYSLSYSPLQNAAYQAVVTKPDQTVMAVSNACQVSVS